MAARRTLALVAGQVGVLAYLSGRWVGMDLLAGAGLFSRIWPRLCAGYAADAIGSKRRAPGSCGARAPCSRCCHAAPPRRPRR
jgi:hypothetical protein